jgi:hypothetical protein
VKDRHYVRHAAADEVGSSTRKPLFRDALKDVGWFPTTYSAVVGAPSILAIAQLLFKEWRLTPAHRRLVGKRARAQIDCVVILEENGENDMASGADDKDELTLQPELEQD